MWPTQKLSAAMAVTASLISGGLATRPMENLGRGLVAVRAGDTAFVSWRLLGLDSNDPGFNLYRSTGSGDFELLNEDEALTGGTNFADDTADLSQDNTYYVVSVVDGEEQGDESERWTLPADTDEEPLFRVPLREGGGPIKYIWVGDPDGDGEYDFVVDRHEERQRIEAYLRDGTFLWEVDLGPNSENQDNIEPGATAIDLGHWDGVTVFDFDGDGVAEVAIRVANGVTFGNGETFEYEDDEHQFLAMIDGATGGLRGYAEVPDDFIDDGPLAARFGVGYLDGETPHLVAFMKNRQPDQGDFNLIEAAYTFDGSEVSMAWKWIRDRDDCPDGHSTRVIDVDGDGADEVVETGFVLDGDGEVRYCLGPTAVHGDRFHVAKMDPSRDGLQGYGVQQGNPDFLYDYYYDAATGEFIWTHYVDENVDVGRGMAGDIDPDHEGYEVWAFRGVYDAAEDELTGDAEDYPWPQLGLWWDGDALLELIDAANIEKWNWTEQTVDRIVTVGHYGATAADGGDPMFQGDIVGDWREEVVYTSEGFDELLVFTTDQPSDIRLYTLMHNPAYRNAVTTKGYVQSPSVDYHLGDGMETPPQPRRCVRCCWS